MTHNDDLDDLLQFDPLLAAETITGHSYKEDDETRALGFLLLQSAAVDKKKALQSTGDTYFNSSLNEQLEVMESLGFKTVLLDFFGGSLGFDETFRIMWHPCGVLATVESYQTFHRNSAKFYYNVRFPVEYVESRHSYTSSGHFHVYDPENGNFIWVGDHDGREAFKHNFTRLAEAGEFLSEWVEQPFLWLLNYKESAEDGYDHEVITQERISRLPEHIRKAVTPQGS